MNKIEIERRLIEFAAETHTVCKSNAHTSSLEPIIYQLSRASISTACHYGEVQSAESRKDFIHKLSIVLKEARESLILLKILRKMDVKDDSLDHLIKECD